jgi:NAD(P)-dependent dehydrogenase (short-subunit alcohol dehydrogenase family)
MAKDPIPRGYARNLFDLEGRVAVVTGAASGLGQAISSGLAQVGAKLTLLDVNEGGLATTQEFIESEGGTATSLVCDVTSSAAVNGAAESVLAANGRVDVLVNCAGSAFRSAAEDFPEDRYDALIALNLKGSFLPCQAFGRAMLAQESGSIINIASIGAFIAYPHAIAYLQSKGGVMQLTRGLALEWRDRNVRVNAIAPTLMDTALIERMDKTTSITSDFIVNRMLRDRLGRPEELIGAAIFLASDASSLVTGVTLPVDDGYLVA